MPGSPSELLRTSDHLSGVPEATKAHWDAVRAGMGKSSVAASEEGIEEVEESKPLPEQLYSD